MSGIHPQEVTDINDTAKTGLEQAEAVVSIQEVTATNAKPKSNVRNRRNRNVSLLYQTELQPLRAGRIRTDDLRLSK